MENISDFVAPPLDDGFDPAPSDVQPLIPLDEPVTLITVEQSGVVHTIEHRSFARDSAEAPMPVTVITGA